MSKESPLQSQARRKFLRSAALLPLVHAGGALLGASAATPTTAQAENATAAQREFVRVPGSALAAHLKSSPLAILPLGSVEYHGPSGPPGTDSMIATGLAQRLVPRLRASLFPTVQYTHSPAHTAAFRGTISIRPETITAYLTDILTGLIAHGFDKIFVLNGHDGNIGSARLAISQVTQEHQDAAVLFVSWWETLPGPLVDSLRLFSQPNGGHGHGGPLELSVAAAFAPESVLPGQGPDLPPIQSFTEDFPYYLEKSRAEGWPGYSGKLSEISPEKGERLVQIALERLQQLVETWLANPAKPGSW